MAGDYSDPYWLEGDMADATDDTYNYDMGSDFEDTYDLDRGAGIEDTYDLDRGDPNAGKGEAGYDWGGLLGTVKEGAKGLWNSKDFWAVAGGLWDAFMGDDGATPSPSGGRGGGGGGGAQRYGGHGDAVWKAEKVSGGVSPQSKAYKKPTSALNA